MCHHKLNITINNNIIIHKESYLYLYYGYARIRVMQFSILKQINLVGSDGLTTKVCYVSYADLM